MARYELYLSTPTGVRLTPLAHFASLEWVRSVNSVGYMTMIFGAEQYDETWFALDRRVEIWRITDVARLIRTYYLRLLSRKVDENGHETVEWSGPDANDLLTRRIVDADAGHADASKTDYADDMLKEIVYEQMGAGAVAARQFTGLTIDPDLGAAPSISKDFARREVLTVLQELCAASAIAGTELYFDMQDVAGFLFKTYIGQIGADRTLLATPFSLEKGSLAPPVEQTTDWREEKNYIYAAGQGEKAAREVVEVQDATRVGESPYNRREALADGRSYETTASLTNFGRTRLREGQPLRNFQAGLRDAPDSRFQVDWDFGDRVQAEYREELYNCLVSAVRGFISAENEVIEAKLAYDW